MARTTRASKTMAQRVGGRIRQLRKAAGMTQAVLSEQSEIDDMTISRLETGARAPNLDQLERIAHVFGVPIAHFLNEEHDPLFIQGREMASMLTKLTVEQQKFILDFIRIYTEAHGKRPNPASRKPKPVR